MLQSVLQGTEFGKPKFALTGKYATNARFGTAMSSVGDINKDGFTGSADVSFLLTV